MNSSFQQKLRKNPRRDGDPPQAAVPQATSIIVALLLVLLIVGGLAHALTDLFLG